MTFYIVTMVGLSCRAPHLPSSKPPAIPTPWVAAQGAGARDTSDQALGPHSSSPPRPPLSSPFSVPGQVVMTIIVAFILEAFVFRMNYSRKNQDSEGPCEGRGACAACCSCVCPAVSFLAVQSSGHSACPSDSSF